jgi:hypothetical protein
MKREYNTSARFVDPTSKKQEAACDRRLSHIASTLKAKQSNLKFVKMSADEVNTANYIHCNSERHYKRLPSVLIGDKYSQRCSGKLLSTCIGRHEHNFAAGPVQTIHVLMPVIFVNSVYCVLPDTSSFGVNPA